MEGGGLVNSYFFDFDFSFLSCLAQAHSAEVPGHRQQQLTQTLIVHLLKTHLPLILKSQQNRIELVTRPGEVKHQLGKSIG